MKNTLLLKHPSGSGILCFIAFVFLLASAQTQVSAQKYFTAETSYAVKLGTTKPLYESASIMPTDEGKLKDRKLNKPRIIPNFGGRSQLISHNPEALPQGPDPLWSPSGSRMATNDIFPIVNIEGAG